MIQFTVYGTPQPQGSARAFYKAGMRRPIVTSDNAKLKPWRQEVSGTAAALNCELLHGAIVVSVDFFFKRPRTAKKDRTRPTVRPDIDKLSRGILDGLSGILFKDDSQVVSLRATKYYGEPERAQIVIEEIS